MRRLSAVAEAEVTAALGRLERAEPLPYRLTHPDYLSERLRIEARMHAAFLAKGGAPELEHPYYFVLGSFPPWEVDGWEKLQLPLEAFSESAVSFTMTDSFFNYRTTNLHGAEIPRAPYHEHLFRLSELADALERFDTPANSALTPQDPHFRPYVEAQLWRSPPGSTNKGRTR